MHKRQLALTILAVLVLIATITVSIAGSITAAASGVGSPGGSGGNASSAPAAAKLIHGDRRDIVGYRFTVYSSAGSMLGHPSDIMLPDSWHVRETFYGYINDDTGHRLVDKVNISRAEKSSDATNANKKTIFTFYNSS